MEGTLNRRTALSYAAPPDTPAVDDHHLAGLARTGRLDGRVTCLPGHASAFPAGDDPIARGGRSGIGSSSRRALAPGPRTGTRQSDAYLLLGLSPPAFLASHLLYGLSIGYGRQLDINWPIKTLMPFGESLLDLVVRIPYPERTEGSKVVMIARPLPDAQALVAAMDRHIASMEPRLGRPMRGRAHWVRGPILGLDAKAIYGMCLASVPGQRLWPTDAEGLTSLDRHEVAHVAIASICPVTLNPPALLSEGWAEANSGQDPVELAERAFRARERGNEKSIQELTGSEWYGRHEWPVYQFGAPRATICFRNMGRIAS